MPFILHAAWLREDPAIPDGNFFFWAENQEQSDSDDAPTALREGQVEGPRGVSTRQRSVKIPSHPLQASVLQLRSMLRQQLPALKVDDLQPVSATVWTPTVDGAPLMRRTALTQPSIAAENARQLRANAAQWQVTGLAATPLAALMSLSRLDNGASDRSAATATIYHRVRLGKDLLFWSHVAKFSLELLINQQYLPALHSHGDGFLIAAWQPYLSDHQMQRRFEMLAQIMPPVCRSYNTPSLADAPQPASLTEHFIAAVIDAAIRKWGSVEAISGDPALPINHWLRQLLNGQRRLNLPPQQAYQFYRDWQEWTEQLQFTRDASFRVYLQLVEPAPESSTNCPPQWTLLYGLQSLENAELRIPARDVWQAQTGSLRVGSRRLDQPQDRLMSGLRGAARIFSPIAHSLRTPQPEYALLTIDEAYRFLKECVPILESSGYSVLLPEWWHVRHAGGLGLRLRLAMHEHDGDEGRPRSAAEPLFGPVHYAWELTLAGQRLGRAEFQQMAAMESPLLRFGNQWIELDPFQVAAAQRFVLDRQPTGIMSLLQAVHVVQGFQQEFEEARGAASDIAAFALPVGAPAVLPIDAIDVDGWLGQVITQLQEQQPPEAIDEPPGFTGALRPYQRRGVGWLAYLRRLGLGACLADDMGLGKTVQAIALLLHVRSSNTSMQESSHHPALLICPTSVVANWRREVQRFAPEMRVLVHHGSGRLTDAAFMEAVAENDLIITSFGTARRDVELLQQWRWSDLILDEAQNIKNPTAKQTQAVRSLSARNRIALTGTPVENRLSELWSIVEFLNPSYLDVHERFRQRYIIPIERYNDDERANELRRLVQPFLLRRVKSDPTIISDLPEKNEMIVYCSLTLEQVRLYEQVVHDTLAQLDSSDGIQRRGLVLGLLTKLKQITNHPAHYLKEEGVLAGRSGKLERLTEMLEEALAVGDHVLVFTQFVEMGALLQRHLREVFGVEVLFLHGGTSAPQRDQLVQLFQEEDGPPIFVLSLRAGGAGINLTRANHVFHFDRWWNPAVENQATDRAFRIGQQRNVQVHKFVVAGTLEERIHAIVEGKQNLADSIIGSGEQWLTELSTEQLRDLLTLRREMLDEL
jgi:SNF2 family DNA or RNA helicase